MQIRRKKEKERNDYVSESEEDFSDTEMERKREYRKGGYHPVHIGELYWNRYRVIQKLGWGYFSTVWLVWDYNTELFAAMKVQKSAAQYTEAAMDEIEVLKQIRYSISHDEWKSLHCAHMLDFFEHRGPNGKHVIMIFEVLGENILHLIEKHNYRGLPLSHVKKIMKQILQALVHIHRLGIIHTDLKPENVLLSAPTLKIQQVMQNYVPPDRAQDIRLSEKNPELLTKSQKKRLKRREKDVKKPGQPAEPSQGSDEADKLAEQVKQLKIPESKPEKHSTPVYASNGLNGSTESLSCVDSEKRDEKRDTQVSADWEQRRTEQVTLADFGNACWRNKKFSDEIQTRQYRSPEVILGYDYDTSTDLWSAACLAFELITGDFLFDPKESKQYSRDEDHLAQMVEALGPIPNHMARGNGKYRDRFLTSYGGFRHVVDLKLWSLEDVLYEKYNFTSEKSIEISQFLRPMLEIDPSARLSAEDMLKTFDWFLEVCENDDTSACHRDQYLFSRNSSCSDDSTGSTENGDPESVSTSFTSQSPDTNTLKVEKLL